MIAINPISLHPEHEVAPYRSEPSTQISVSRLGCSPLSSTGVALPWTAILTFVFAFTPFVNQRDSHRRPLALLGTPRIAPFFVIEHQSSRKFRFDAPIDRLQCKFVGSVLAHVAVAWVPRPIALMCIAGVRTGMPTP